jgi:hypothetical protein
MWLAFTAGGGCPSSGGHHAVCADVHAVKSCASPDGDEAPRRVSGSSVGDGKAGGVVPSIRRLRSCSHLAFSRCARADQRDDGVEHE